MHEPFPFRQRKDKAEVARRVNTVFLNKVSHFSVPLLSGGPKDHFSKLVFFLSMTKQNPQEKELRIRLHNFTRLFKILIKLAKILITSFLKSYMLYFYYF